MLYCLVRVFFWGGDDTEGLQEDSLEVDVGLE